MCKYCSLPLLLELTLFEVLYLHRHYDDVDHNRDWAAATSDISSVIRDGLSLFWKNSKGRRFGKFPVLPSMRLSRMHGNWIWSWLWVYYYVGQSHLNSNNDIDTIGSSGGFNDDGDERRKTVFICVTSSSLALPRQNSWDDKQASDLIFYHLYAMFSWSSRTLAWHYWRHCSDSERESAIIITPSHFILL